MAALHGFTNLRAEKIATSDFGDSDMHANPDQAGQEPLTQGKGEDPGTEIG